MALLLRITSYLQPTLSSSSDWEFSSPVERKEKKNRPATTFWRETH